MLSLSKVNVEPEEVYEDDHVRAFTRIWINEAESPGLLPYAEESVEVICQLLDNQMAILEALPRSPNNAFRSRLYQLEMSRLSFQLSAYHRCRLMKIVRNAYYYSQYQRSLLNPREAVFLDTFRGCFEEELKEYGLEGIAEQERLFPDKTLLAGNASPGDPIVDTIPEDCRHVVVRMLRAASQIQLDPSTPHELHDLLKDDIVLLQYKVAKRLLLDELAECI